MKVLSKEHKNSISRGLKKYWDKKGRKGTVGKNGYMTRGSHSTREYEHRRVVEDFLGRSLKKNEVIHHKDGDRLNNDISNLVLMTKREHARLHAIENGLGSDRVGVSPTNKLSEIKVLREEEKTTIGSIAKKLGISYPTAWKYCKEFKLNKREL
jgi:hypothetical protein